MIQVISDNGHAVHEFEGADDPVVLETLEPGVYSATEYDADGDADDVETWLIVPADEDSDPYTTPDDDEAEAAREELGDAA